MEKLVRTCEEVEDIDILGEEDSPIYYRRTYVVDRDGELIPPTRTISPPVEKLFRRENRFTWTEEWDLPKGAAAIEVFITRHGSTYRSAALPGKFTINQVLALEDILQEFEISSAERDEYQFLQIYQACRGFMPNLDMFILTG